MSRIDGLLNNGLEQEVRYLESELEQIKTVQFMGKDIVVPKVIQTGAEWDLESDDFFGDQAIADFVDFFADNQSNPFASLVIETFDTDGNPLATDYFDQFSVDRMSRIVDDRSYGFFVFISKFSSSAVFRAKLTILATDTGVIL
jgi:hypothetical protein